MISRLDQAFTILPRNGHENPVWVPRHDAEKRISQVLLKQGKSICLDGPSGTGKSSTALTCLVEHKLHFIRFQLVNALTWNAFARLFLESIGTERPRVKEQFRFGLKRMLPEFTYTREREKGQKRAHYIVNGREYSEECFSEYDLGQIMADLDMVLVVDDFEKASASLVRRFADVAKLLTDTFQSPHARIFYVGTHDIYRRLRTADVALPSRLEQVSLGTLAHQGFSWMYLKKGFEYQGFLHPGNPRHPDSNTEDEIIACVFEAADGLLKTLSDLGRTISQKTPGVTIDRATILAECKSLVHATIREYETEIPGFVADILDNPAKKLLMKWLFAHGVGHVHNLDILIHSDEHCGLSRDQIYAAYASLRSQGFLIHIGFKDADRTFYITDPRFAHIFGVICTHHAKYNIGEEILRLTGQLELPFYWPGSCRHSM